MAKQASKSYHPNITDTVNIMITTSFPVVFVIALVVRFLAKRFLPEYDGDADKTYTRAVTIEGKLLNLSILDKAGKVTDLCLLMNSESETEQTIVIAVYEV